MSSTGDEIRIESGYPTDDEIAALTAVVLLAATPPPAVGSGTPDSARLDGWGRPELLHRNQMPFSPYAFGLGGR